MPNETGRFLRACAGVPTDTTPVWYMRQAGRYQASYRELRKRLSLLEICERPAECAEVTCRPVRDLGVDAAILFSDIMVPLGPAGVEFRIEEGVGPVVEAPVRSRADIERLKPISPEADLPHVLETVRLVTRELGKTPLIGFAGGPFTLASYLIEGGPSRQYAMTKRLLFEDQTAWDMLMQRLGAIIGAHLRAQVEAGAAAVQIFDSWVGCLAPWDYERAVLPTVRRIVTDVQALGVPAIVFGVGTGELLSLMAESGAAVVGVDFRVPLQVARARVGEGAALQGNLDPAMLFAPWPQVEERVRCILREAQGSGHIFNLGHGVQPQTDPVRLRELTTLVHELGKEERS